MRPQSIVQFEMVFFLALATAVAVQLLEGVSAAGLAALAAAVAVNLALWYLIARRASALARWIYALLFAIGLALLLYSGASGQLAGGLGAVAGVAQILLNALALWLLFRPDANAWFAAKASP